MPLVVNFAFTWANQTSGSAGQNDVSLRMTVAAEVERLVGSSMDILVSRSPI